MAVSFLFILVPFYFSHVQSLQISEGPACYRNYPSETPIPIHNLTKDEGYIEYQSSQNIQSATTCTLNIYINITTPKTSHCYGLNKYNTCGIVFDYLDVQQQSFHNQLAIINGEYGVDGFPVKITRYNNLVHIYYTCVAGIPKRTCFNQSFLQHYFKSPTEKETFILNVFESVKTIGIGETSWESSLYGISYAHAVPSTATPPTIPPSVLQSTLGPKEIPREYKHAVFIVVPLVWLGLFVATLIVIVLVHRHHRKTQK